MAGQVDNGELWLINNFINIKYNPDWFPAGIYFANNEYRNKMVEFYDCPYLLMQKLNHSENKKVGNKDIVDILIENISQDRFVIFMVDRLYLNIGWEQSNEHQLMVHGYDISEKKFYYADHLRDGKYKTGITCSFGEMKQAFETTITYDEEPEFKNTIFTFSPVQNSYYKLNLNHIISQLKYYYYGNQVLFDDYYKSGIQVYSELASYFEKELMNRTAITDVRGVTVLKDHNSAMEYRIRYLSQMLNKNFESLKLYEMLKDNSERIVMLYVKYCITKDYKILSRIIEMLYTLEKCEKKAVKLLLNELCVDNKEE